MKTVLSTLNRYVSWIPAEGSATKEQIEFFHRLLQANRDVRVIGETGFNDGVSSRAFLSARPDITVVSFDLGQHMAVNRAKPSVDAEFPGRHELVLGDSTVTLPAYARAHPHQRFDLVFVDGGHEYDIAKADLLNFRSLSHAKTIVVMDDLTPWLRWGQGPTKAWTEAIQGALVVQHGLYKNGKATPDTNGRGFQRIWALGSYRDTTDAVSSGAVASPAGPVASNPSLGHERKFQ